MPLDESVTTKHNQSCSHILLCRRKHIGINRCPSCAQYVCMHATSALSEVVASEVYVVLHLALQWLCMLLDPGKQILVMLHPRRYLLPNLLVIGVHPFNLLFGQHLQQSTQSLCAISCNTCDGSAELLTWSTKRKSAHTNTRYKQYHTAVLQGASRRKAACKCLFGPKGQHEGC